MRRSVLLAVLLFAGCSAAEPDQSAMRRAFIEQADQVRRAMLEDDHGKLVDLTLPLVVEKVGGRQKMIQSLDSTARGLKVRWPERAVKLGEPTGLVRGGEDWYGVIPFTLELRQPGRSETARSFLVGVSTDRGMSWKFLDGGVSTSRAQLQSLLPNFPSNLPLPEDENFVAADDNLVGTTIFPVTSEQLVDAYRAGQGGIPHEKWTRG